MINKLILIGVILTIAVLSILVFMQNIGEKIPKYDPNQILLCDGKTVHYNLEHPTPVSNLNSWEIAQRYDTLEFVKPPNYIPDGFELEIFYLGYPDLITYYRHVDEPYDECDFKTLEKGFMIKYRSNDLTITSKLLDSSELTKIIESLPFEIDEFRVNINGDILR